MLLQTILNKCHGFSNFKYSSDKFDNESAQIEIEIEAKKSSKARCSKCKEKSPTYDHQKLRGFKFVPILGFKANIIYRPRRVKCKKHGVITALGEIDYLL